MDWLVVGSLGEWVVVRVAVEDWGVICVFLVDLLEGRG